MNNNWLLFRAESDPVYYFWDGCFPVIVKIPAVEGPRTETRHDWTWNGEVDFDLTKDQRKILEEIADPKCRKRTFTVPNKHLGDKRRWLVVARGTFDDE